MFKLQSKDVKEAIHHSLYDWSKKKERPLEKIHHEDVIIERLTHDEAHHIGALYLQFDRPYEIKSIQAHVKLDRDYGPESKDFIDVTPDDLKSIVSEEDIFHGYCYSFDIDKMIAHIQDAVKLAMPKIEALEISKEVPVQSELAKLWVP